MKSFKLEFSYTEQKEFRFDLYSDMHVDAKHCKRESLKKSLQDSYDNSDGILINGDLFSCLLPKDRKRFTLAHAIECRDDYLDYIIDYVADFLSPYADKILFMGMGNHCTSVINHHATNPLDRLRRQLKDHGCKAFVGDYSNFLMMRFYRGDNDGIRTYNIWASHGWGAGAKRSRGALDWDIAYANFDADLYWMGHNHQGQIDEARQRVYIDRNGNIKTKPVRGVRTPAWEEPVSIRDVEDKYDLKYGEERHGVPCAPQGKCILKIIPRSNGDTTKSTAYIDQW